ncbi:MAG TPA: VOC family protein [Streptosporangiaceae bacterium]|nr:VOC family protein [Streptosporangiaceae bacterium]
MPTGFHHVTLNVTDLTRARAFYYEGNRAPCLQPGKITSQEGS